MRYRYQLIFLGENEEIFRKIRSEVEDRFDELKLVQDLLKIITKENISEYKGAEPAYIIYSGHKDKLDKKTEEILKNQKLDGNVVLPIFLNDFAIEMPNLLLNQNGLKFDNK